MGFHGRITGFFDLPNRRRAFDVCPAQHLSLLVGQVDWKGPRPDMAADESHWLEEEPDS